MAADKARGGNWVYAEEVLKTLSAHQQVETTTLILYHEWALPLVEMDSPQAAAEAYRRVEPLQGRPEPALAFREAFHVAQDYGEEAEPLAALILWSAAARPRIRLEPHTAALDNSGVPWSLVILRPSPPGWARYVGLPERFYTYRSTTSPQRLLTRLLERASQVRGRPG